MKLPDRPPTPPFVQLLQWISTPVEYMETSAQRCGDCFTAQLSNLGSFVFLSNPQAIQELMTADPKLFDIGKGNNILRPLLGEHSLILLDGANPQRQRQLLIPPFHGERMRAYGKLICDITQAAMSSQTDGKPFRVRSCMPKACYHQLTDCQMPLYLLLS